MSYEFSDFDNYSGSFDSGDLFSRNDNFLSDSESGETGSESSEGGESQNDYSEYSDIIGSIDTNSDILVERLDTLSLQLDNLNLNVVVLNENIKFGCGLVFTLTVIVFIRFIFIIFTRLFGFDKA